MASTKKNAIKGMSVFADSKNWQAEDDVRTLQRAKEIRADPKRLKAARELAKTKLAELASIATGDEK